MKLTILDKNGKKMKEFTTELFEEPIRIDIIRKVIEAEREWHPNAPKLYAGMNRSASGQVRHKRHSWKSDRGKGMPRIPKKQMWRRGTQFSWEGAIIPSVRGGRRAHPPHGQLNNKKINKKEYQKAFLSSLSYISSPAEVQKKYDSLHTTSFNLSLPIIFDSQFFQMKTKEFLASLETVLGNSAAVAIQKKNLRAGRGKARGRKYKRSSGLLFVVGNNERAKISGIEMKPAQELTVSDIAENGARLTAFSEQAIKDLEKKYLEKKEKINLIENKVKEKKK
ncbi:MAG: hypothetical protein RL557_440 [archaeon]|jgi:large subunit ribosomal protein L4e